MFSEQPTSLSSFFLGAPWLSLIETQFSSVPVKPVKLGSPEAQNTFGPNGVALAAHHRNWLLNCKADPEVKYSPPKLIPSRPRIFFYFSTIGLILQKTHCSLNQKCIEALLQFQCSKVSCQECSTLLRHSPSFSKRRKSWNNFDTHFDWYFTVCELKKYSLSHAW